MTTEPEEYEGSLTEMVCDVINELPLQVKRRLYALKGIGNWKETIAKHNQEIGALQTKYHALYQNIYAQRVAILTGSFEPASASIRAGADFAYQRDLRRAEKEKVTPPPQETEAVQEDGTIVGIPNFWLTALKHHPDFCDQITERDAKVLEHLIDIREEMAPNPYHGFKLFFEFGPGAKTYFAEQVLVKEYTTKEVEQDTVFVNAVGCPITWKDNEHNVTVMLQKRKQRNRRGGQTRVTTKEIPCDSFFNFFTPPRRSTKEEINDAIASGEGTKDDDELRVQDYELGCLFRDEIIPQAVDFYSGFAAYNQGYNDSDEDDEDDAEDDFEDV